MPDNNSSLIRSKIITFASTVIPTVNKSPAIPGRVKTVFVKNNQQVKKGQKLFKIDTAKLKLDLSEQKQNLLTIKKVLASYVL